MLRFIFMRFSRAILTLIGVVTLVFFLVRLVPGDPVDAILGEQADPADRAQMRVLLGLDQPILSQYVRYVSEVCKGNLGRSFRKQSVNVTDVIAEVFDDTLMLSLSAVLLAWIISIPLGALAALKRNTLWDRIASAIAWTGQAIPGLWLGPVLLYFFAVQWRLLPVPGADATGVSGIILPSVTIAFALCSSLTRQTRSAMIEVLSLPYITAARARGVRASVVVFKHAFRNALIPLVTVAGSQFAGVLSGTVVTEKIFNRRGIGTLFIDAFFSRDIPVVQACVLVTAAMYIVVQLMVDNLYAWIDPRIRN